HLLVTYVLESRDDLEHAAALGVEQTREHRRRVELGETQECDATVETDERHRLHVADDAVGLYGWIAFFDICLFCSWTRFLVHRLFSARARRARSVLGGRAMRGRSRSRAEGATGAKRRRGRTGRRNQQHTAAAEYGVRAEYSLHANPRQQKHIRRRQHIIPRLAAAHVPAPVVVRIRRVV